MTLFKNFWFYIFISFYILIEISLRNHAIDVIGTIHVLPYKVNSLELIGRFISSIGFTIFIIQKSSKSSILSGFFKKALFSISCFFAIFLLQKAIFDNIHYLVDDSKKESLYYSSLFKDGSYYMNNVSKHLPYSIENKDSVEFKTFYGLSLFLYENNSEINQHVKKFETEYKTAIINNFFDEKDLNTLSSQSYSDVVLSHDLLIKINGKLETKIATSITKEYYESAVMYRLYRSLWLHYQTKVRNKENLAGYQELKRLRDSGVKKIKNTSYLSKLVINDIGYTTANNIYLNVVDNFLRKITSKELSNEIRGIQPSTYDFNFSHFLRLVRMQFYLTNKEDYKEIFSFVFKGLSNEDFERYFIDGFAIKKNNRFSNFINSNSFVKLDSKYKNWLIDSKKQLFYFFRNYEKNAAKLIPELGTVYYYSEDHNSFKTELRSKFKEYILDNISSMRENKELLAKSLVIPPMVLLISDIALFLNVALLLSSILGSFIGKSKVEKYLFFIIFSIIVVFSGYGFKKSEFDTFGSGFAKESMDISSYKINTVDWFINKNKNMKLIGLNKINILDPVVFYVDIYEAEKALENKELLSVIYQDRID